MPNEVIIPELNQAQELDDSMSLPVDDGIETYRVTAEQLKEYIEEKAKTFDGATEETGGEKGMVPAPQAGDENKFLRGDGEWASLGDLNPFPVGSQYTQYPDPNANSNDLSVCLPLSKSPAALFGGTWELLHTENTKENGALFFRTEGGLSHEISGRAGGLQDAATALPNASFTTNSTGAHRHQNFLSQIKTNATNDPLTSGSSPVQGRDVGGQNSYRMQRLTANNTANPTVGRTSSTGAHTHTIGGGDPEGRVKNRIFRVWERVV